MGTNRRGLGTNRLCTNRPVFISTPPLHRYGMLVHRRVTPKHYIFHYLFIHLGGERHCESKVSCPRTQSSAPARTRTRTSQSGVQCTNHYATEPLTLLRKMSKPYSRTRNQSAVTHLYKNFPERSIHYVIYPD